MEADDKFLNMGLRNFFTKKITFLIGPEVSAHFFKASESDLSQQEVYQFNVPTFGPVWCLMFDYSVRQEQFRIFTESLGVNKLKGYVDQMVTEAEIDVFFCITCCIWFGCSVWHAGEEISLFSNKWFHVPCVQWYELEHLIILTASRCLLGREVRDKLFEDVSALFHDLDNGMLPISVIFPYLPLPAHRAQKKLAEIFAIIISYRKRAGKSENDMLQCFIESKYKDGRPTTEAEVTGLLIAALFAGQHTSSITSTWTGAYLLRHKEFLSAVVDEQKQLIQKHGTKLHADFSVKTRDGKEYDIPKSHIVATSPAFANRLPHIYKDPDAYDPDRFRVGREEDKEAGAFSYISFGGGRHGCLREPFAYTSSWSLCHLFLRLTGMLWWLA
ncbi:hypothetical protein V6N13_134880 [Hibiscus sabdariffa]